jgi:hypothetical protein|tara:strand:- start:716 stop:1258 length:543 start_codon:yes stop_codon:yes gene_type:complete
MKTQIINNIVSNKELFFIYKQIISSPSWSIDGITNEMLLNKQFSHAPLYAVKSQDGTIDNYAFYLYVKTLVFRMEEILKNKNIGMHTKIKRSWFNITYSDSENHWLHQDSSDSKFQTVLIFMTPIWQDGWKGSLHVDGEEFKFKPGDAVIFDSNKFHVGKKPIGETHNWMRLTLNIILEP